VEDCLSNSKISIIRPYKVYLLKFSNNIRSVLCYSSRCCTTW